MNKIEVHSFNKKFHLYIRDEADASVAAEIFKEREYRKAEEWIEKCKLPIIDVGAHSGMFAIYARSINPEVKIVCVEPEPDNLRLLQRHLKENEINNVQIVEAALSDRSGKGYLEIAADSHNHHLTEKSEKTINVDKYSLPDLLKKCIIDAVGLLKLDIEGGEYDVFRVLEENSFQKIRAVVMEYHNGEFGNGRELEKKFREMGFSVQVFPSRFDRSMGFIFALNKRVAYGT